MPRFAITRFDLPHAPLPTRSQRTALLTALLIAASIVGCNSKDPIVTYTIDTEMPAELQPGKDRMLAAMVPKGDQVWFFKVTGPEAAISDIETTFRQFVREVEFADEVPVLEDLPAGWRRGGEKAFRFASIDVETPSKQLDISISQLTRQEDWDEQVSMNVNRWRGQLGLDPSDEKWAEGEEFEIAAADSTGIWVDLLGEPGDGGSMSAPFVNRGGGMTPPPTSQQPATATLPDSRLKFDRPEGWRDGRMSSMRWAAFNIGPEESPAEMNRDSSWW